jgi:hypothetical protein
MESVVAIHGHGDNTQVEWVNEMSHGNPSVEEELEMKQRKERENDFISPLAKFFGTTPEEFRSQIKRIVNG